MAKKEPKAVAFHAVIRMMKHKSLVSGDKSSQVLVEFNTNPEVKYGKLKATKVLNILNELQIADKMVDVVIMERKET